MSLYDFSPPEVYKSHILNRSFNKLYITCILIELLAQIKKILRYAMWQNQWDHGMPNSNTSSNTSASCSLKKMEVGHVENLLHRFHLRISNVCNFFISERKHQVWVVIFLDRNKHFGAKFIVFSRIFSFCSSILQFQCWKPETLCNVIAYVNDVIC